MKRECQYCLSIIPEDRHANAITCCKEHSIKLKKKREKENYINLIKSAGRELKERKSIKETSIIKQPVFRELTMEEMFFPNTNNKTKTKKRKLNDRGRPRIHFPEPNFDLPAYTISYSETILERFGKDLTYYIRSRGLKLDEVSEILGIDRYSLRDILKGKYILDRNLLDVINKNFPELNTSEVESFLDGKIVLCATIVREVSFGQYIGHRIREYRKKHNYPMLTFSKLVGSDNGYLTKVEDGKFDTISLQLLYNLSKLFKCKASDLLNF